MRIFMGYVSFREGRPLYSTLKHVLQDANTFPIKASPESKCTMTSTVKDPIG